MRFPGVYGERCATGYQADISKRLVKGGMNRIKDIKMRFTSALALLAAGALPLGYAAVPTIAHGFEKSHDHGPSKADRKRAEQEDRTGVEEGKSVSGRGDQGGRRNLKK